MSSWTELEVKGINPGLINYLRNMLNAADFLEFDIQSISNDTGTFPTAVEELLTELSMTREDVRRGMEYICPYCDHPFRDNSAPDDHCCEANAYILVPEEDFTTKTYFYRNSLPSRDIRWVVVIHGMNTRGPWQEEFAWGLSQTFGHTIPQYIYKYGLLRIGVLRKRVQRHEVLELAEKLRRLSECLTGVYAGTRPDIIAHSFGTWLIHRVLKDNPDIRIGRLILLGSIVRPDFDWQELVDRGQVEYILNHCAGLDEWVPWSHFCIPDSGPGGQKGFAARNLLNICSAEFKHDEFFTQDHMRGAFSKDGVWRRFLTRPAPNLPDSFPESFQASVWSASPVLGKVVRGLLLALVFLLFPLLALFEGTRVLLSE